jgi:hypothetical protein
MMRRAPGSRTRRRHSDRRNRRVGKGASSRRATRLHCLECVRLPRWVMAGLVPATPLNKARPCPVIGVAGTSPAMTQDLVHLIQKMFGLSRGHASLCPPYGSSCGRRITPRLPPCAAARSLRRRTRPRRGRRRCARRAAAPGAATRRGYATAAARCCASARCRARHHPPRR